MKYYECDLCGKHVVNKSYMYKFRIKCKKQPDGCYDIKREICRDCAFEIRKHFIAAMNKNKEDNHENYKM